MKNLKHLFLALFLSVATMQGQTRSDIQVLIDNIATGVPNTALKVRTVLNVVANGTAQTGDVKEIDVVTSYIAANFDATGLGTNERLGWAICNGNNGTRNRSGRVPLQYNASTYPTLGATGGATTHTLTSNETPPVTITYTASADDNSGGGTYINTSPVQPDGTRTLTTNGGGQAHNNMQPYIVTLFIQKL